MTPITPTRNTPAEQWTPDQRARIEEWDSINTQGSSHGRPNRTEAEQIRQANFEALREAHEESSPGLTFDQLPQQPAVKEAQGVFGGLRGSVGIRPYGTPPLVTAPNPAHLDEASQRRAAEYQRIQDEHDERVKQARLEKIASDPVQGLLLERIEKLEAALAQEREQIAAEAAALKKANKGKTKYIPSEETSK